MTKQSLELTVTEDPITGTWTFTLHGHRIEIERTHGFIKIDTTIHDAPLVQTLNDVQDLAGAPLDYIQHLLSTTTPPVPPGRPARPASTTESQRTPAAAPNKAPSKAKRIKRPRTEARRTEPGAPQPSGERVVLTTDQAGAFLGLSPTTLETLRTRGGGPPFVKLGRRVVYRSEDLAHWLAQRVRRSTSDPGTT